MLNKNERRNCNKKAINKQMAKNLSEKIDVSQKYSRKLITGKVTATNGVRNFQNLNFSNYASKNRFDILRSLEASTKFRMIWYIIFVALGITCLIIEPKSWFCVLDLFILMINIDLVTRGKVVGIYIGIIECIMYAYISYKSALFGEAIKMLIINIPLNIFSIISWTKSYKKQKTDNKKYSQEESSTITVRKINIKNIWWLALLFVALYVGSYFGLKVLGTNVLILSTLSFVLMIFTKLLNGLRYLESWIFDILTCFVNLILWAIVIFSNAGAGFNLTELPVLAIQLALLSNAIFAFIMWKIMYRKVAVDGQGMLYQKRQININKIITLKRQYQKLYWNKEIDERKNNQ